MYFYHLYHHQITNAAANAATNAAANAATNAAANAATNANANAAKKVTIFRQTQTPIYMYE